MKFFFYVLLVILIAGCKEKYNPPFSSPDTGYLVVEGNINTGPDSTYIELSRTNKLNSTQKQYEEGARVQVEGNDNSSYLLAEIETGRYSASLQLNQNNKYRLRIQTLAGKEYLSDFVEVKISPPIDSISWKRENNGVQLYVSTHDPQNNTQYYQWDYQETWEFHSAFLAVLKFDTRDGPNGLIPYVAFKDSSTYGPDTTVFKCWRSLASNLLVLGSSAKLSVDLIYKPFLFIPGGDRKISAIYSINLKQYAITKTGYEFLEKMRKNTEENGSIFDPQPSQLKGNIYCVTDPNEPVIGYINISSVEEKRIFISNSQLPGWNFTTDCKEIRVKNDPDSIEVVWRTGGLPTDVLATFGTNITYFGATNTDCLDCTLSGTNVKPVFWP